MSKLIATIEEGQVEGKKSKNYLGETFLSFLAIPYAEPPIGELRFRAPVPKKPWKDVRKAVKPGPACPSPHLFFRYYVGSEAECLHLNVFTKSLPSSDTTLKPVMVWIHGGAFKMGCNQAYMNGPEYLLTEDIVLVSINYRLGIFGFLCLEDISLGVPGNAGLKDMVLALKWVQRNIKSFNGNPENVTIFGESAGGAAVHHLFLSPMGNGLFHKVIAQSGCALNIWAMGCTNGRVAAKFLRIEETNEDKILQYLQNVSPKKLVKAIEREIPVTPDVIVLPFAPVVEKSSSEPSFYTEQPLDILKKGTFNKVPIIMGYTSEESIMFQFFFTWRPSLRFIKDFEKQIPYNLSVQKGTKRSKDIAIDIQKFYLDGEEVTTKNYKKTFPLKSDIYWVVGIHRSIAYQKTSSNIPVYLYRMSVETSLNSAKKAFTAKCALCNFLCRLCAHRCRLTKRLCMQLTRLTPHVKIDGACHGDDISYLFTTYMSPKLKRNSIEEISVRRFVKLWTNFARTGNPTPLKMDLLNVIWQPVTQQKFYFLDIGRELTMGSDPDYARMKFWFNVYGEKYF